MTGAGRPLPNSCGPGLPSAFLEVFMTENAFWPNPTTSSPALPLLHPFFCNDGAARCPLWATEVAHVQWRQEARISGLDPPPGTTTMAWSWDWRPCCLSGASAGTLCTRFGDNRFLSAGAHFPSFPLRIPHFDVHSSPSHVLCGLLQPRCSSHHLLPPDTEYCWPWSSHHTTSRLWDFLHHPLVPPLEKKMLSRPSGPMLPQVMSLPFERCYWMTYNFSTAISFRSRRIWACTQELAYVTWGGETLLIPF